MSTIRVQMDGNGNFIEETLEGARGAKAENAESSTITWRDTTNMKTVLNVNPGAHSEIQGREQERRANEYMRSQVQPLFRPQEKHESDAQYSRRMLEAERRHGIYQQMVDNALTQLELSREIEAQQGETIDGVTERGRDELSRELAVQAAAGVGNFKDPF